jgi:hypothetical protein
LGYDKTLYHEGVDKRFLSPMVACCAPLKLPVQSKLNFLFAFKSMSAKAISYTIIPQPMGLNRLLVRT